MWQFPFLFFVSSLVISNIISSCVFIDLIFVLSEAETSTQIYPIITSKQLSRIQKHPPAVQKTFFHLPKL